MTHICVGNLTIIGQDNSLSPGRRQAIFWTNAGILLIWPLGTNFSEILIEILTFSFNKMRMKVSSAKRRPFCLGLNVLNQWMYSGREFYWGPIHSLVCALKPMFNDSHKWIVNIRPNHSICIRLGNMDHTVTWNCHFISSSSVMMRYVILTFYTFAQESHWFY